MSTRPSPSDPASPFRLKLLGGASLERDGGVAVAGRAVHRHRLALLAALACAPGSAMGRERLIALLWPESDREKGRNLLKVAVYELRKTLGDDALITAGEELRLDPAIVGSDVRDLDDAAGRGDNAGVVASYGGPLLDGFHLDDAHEFDEWTEAERSRLAALYAGSLERMAESAAARGDHEAAVSWWKRRAAADPLDSRVAAALMQALDASGNRGGALQHASLHERLLQEELGIPLPASVQGLVGRLRASPAAPVPAPTAATPSAPNEAIPSSNATSAAPAQTPARRARWRWLAAAAVVIALGVGGWYARRGATDHPAPSVAVLPFVNIGGDSTNEYFSDGITEEIISRLAAYPSLKVISRTSAMRYKRTEKSLREIARELGVAHVLEGSVRREGDQVRITAQLIDAGTDQHRWAQSYDRKFVDALRVQSEIADEVGRALEVQLRGPAPAAMGTRDPEAYQLYLRARANWYTRSTEGHEQAIALLNQAIARDSNYVEAHIGLANAWFTAFQFNVFGLRDREQDAFAHMQTATTRAYALDSLSPDVHTMRAVMHMWRRDWPKAEQEYKRALDLNPGNGLARMWYGTLLGLAGRTEDAVRENRLAWEVDPYNAIASNSYAVALLQAGRLEESLAQGRLTVEVGPKWARGKEWLAIAFSLAGRHEEAVRTMRDAVATDPRQVETRADLAYVLARAGQRDEARALVRDVIAHPAGPLSTAAFNIAHAYVGLGETDSAFTWLARADYRWPRAHLFMVTLDPLKQDPRYAQLTRRMLGEMHASEWATRP